MGRDTSSVTYTHAERTRYRITMRENLETFARYLPKADFAPAGSIGMEMEMNLIDADGRPVRRATRALETIGNDDFTTELGAHNVELNLPAFPVAGDNLDRVEQALRARMAGAQERAAGIGLRLLPIGILPTLTAEDLRAPDWRNPENRYQALDHAILEARGENIAIRIQGDDDIDVTFDSIAPESACTSVQLHLQVTPSGFAPTWNAAQAIAGPQVALSANSPFFLGKAGWAESRIPVFTQAADTRPPEFVTQGVRPRVWFGERWINNVFDLWEENVRYFPAILPESRQAAGASLLTEGAAPRLHELVLHNGTVWRWNRPIYDPGSGGRPNLRVENRVLSAGPTIADQMADAAFFYGLVTRLARQVRPIWSRMPFAEAEANFTACARLGLDAEVSWPGYGRIPVAELLVTELIPLAAKGLTMLDVDAELIERYMSVVKQRAVSGRNGAAWQRHVVARLEGEGLSRDEALVQMTCRYRDHQDAGRPVHTWSA
jgi:gamma-glutamyl:cysteine ligase YbdK (ATP-grasp superfamily)